MKHISAFIYTGILCLLLACSCNGSKNNDPKADEMAIIQADAIPIDAIPFHYLNDTIKVILIDAVLNGTDSIIVGWDTGAAATYLPLAYQDSLKGKDSISLKLGNQTVIYRDKIHFSDQYTMGKAKGQILGNWDLFRDKIVEISYDPKYLRVLDSTDGLEGYECIPYKFNKMDKHLYIPISVCIQGKVFHIEAPIDTGFNFAFAIYEKEISGVNLPPRKKLPKPKDYWMMYDRKILADTIRIAGAYVTDMDIHIATPNPKTGKMGVPNLLGNGFLSQFSVVFDFKNQNLYLKPLKN